MISVPTPKLSKLTFTSESLSTGDVVEGQRVQEEPALAALRAGVLGLVHEAGRRAVHRRKAMDRHHLEPAREHAGLFAVGPEEAAADVLADEVEASDSSTMKVPEAVRAIPPGRLSSFAGWSFVRRGHSRPVEASAGLLGPLDDGRRPRDVQRRCPLDLLVGERALLVEAVPDRRSPRAAT